MEEQGSHGGNPNHRGCFSIPPYLLGNYQILLAGLSKLPFPKQDKSLPSGSSHSRERETDNKHTSNRQNTAGEECAMQKTKLCLRSLRMKTSELGQDLQEAGTWAGREQRPQNKGQLGLPTGGRSGCQDKVCTWKRELGPQRPSYKL